MILVLAGNKREFDKFLENHYPKDIFRFISDETDYAGHKNCDLLIVGSYRDNPLWKKTTRRKKLKSYCAMHGIDILDAYKGALMGR